MAHTNRPSPSPRQQRSWRAEAAAPMTPLARRSRLVLVTIVVCALAAAMAYALYVPHEPQTHLVYTTLVEHKELTAPPWAKTFLTPDELEKITSKTVPSPEEIESQDKDILPALGSRIRESVGDPQDRLLVLVGGQGVSRVDPASKNQSKAYLLLSIFDPSDPDTGYLSIESLLAEVRTREASAKVLVLDAGNIVCDPRIGMLANEFPPLVEQAVRATNDPNLWVLMSNWTWEISHLSNEKQRSVFSYYVGQGLQGHANRARTGLPDDRMIDLRELYDYVHFGVSKWVEKAHGANSSQHPILLNGAKGRIRRLDEISDVPLVAMAPEPPLGQDAVPAPTTSAPAPAAQSNSKASRGVSAVLAVGMPLLLAQAESTSQPPAAAPAPKPASESTSTPPAPSTAPPNSPASAVESAPVAAPNAPQTPPASEPSAAPTTSAPATPAPATAPSDAKPPSPADPQPTKPKPAAARPATPRSLALANLLDGWKLRDRIEREARSDATQMRSPADFAPHKWREHQERLLHYELMFRSGEDPSDINRKLPDNVLLLADVADGKPMERRHRLSLVSSLAEDWERYRNLKSYPAHSEVVVRAMALRDDLLVRLPYFVRWYAVTSLDSPGDEPGYDSIRKLITDVAALSKSLDAARVDSTPRYDEAQLNELVTRVAADQARLMESAPRPDEKTSISEVECYLSTPLANADERAALLAWLSASDREQYYFDDLAKEFPNRTTQPDALLGPPGGNSEEPWERVAKLAQLELAVAELIDPGSGLFADDNDLQRELRTLQDAVAKAILPFEGEAAEQEVHRWKSSQTVGRALEGFYAELVTQIRSRQRELAKQEGNGERPDARQVAGIEHLYQLLDARDADEEELGSLVPLLESNPDDPVATEITFNFAPVDQLMLDARQETTPLQLVTRLRRGRPTDAWVTLKYDRQLLDILDVEGTAVDNPSERILADISQQPKSFSLDGAAPLERFMNFQLRATAEARKRLQPGDGIPVMAALYYRNADLSIVGPVERTILVRPALPEVELLVGGPVNKNPAPGSGATLVLNPFPNKDTQYQLQVFNRSKEPQEVTVAIMAVPTQLGELVPKRWPLNEAGQPLSESLRLQTLAKGSCTVPPGGQIPIKFEKPAPQTPAATAATPPPAPAPAPEAPAAAEPPPPSIDYGIVCLLEDKAGRRSVTNIDLEPKRPADFLDVDVTWDKARPQRVQVAVYPSGHNPAVMPPGVCKVIWDWRGELEIDRAKKDTGELLPPAYAAAELFGDVPTSQSTPVRVQLDVDGFPRAFSHRLEIARDASVPLRDEERVRITAPADDGFPILAPVDSIPVHFQVDVPADAFKSRGTDDERDVVEIGLVDTERKPLPPGQALQFHADRQIALYLAGAGEDGTLTINAIVKDFDVTLPTAGLSNQRVGILASFKRNRRVVVDAYREVFLDATEPLVVAVGDTAGGAGGVTVEKGAEATVFAEVQDEGGVEKVEFFVVKPAFDVEKDWKNPEKLLPDSAIGGVYRNNRWEASIPTSDLKGSSWLLLARATDRVGLQDKKAIPFEMTMPPSPDGGGNQPARMYDLKGVVVGDGISTITVTLEEPKRTTKTRPNAEFVFERLPAGEYNLSVEAVVRNITQPPKSVSVTLPQEQPVQISF